MSKKHHSRNAIVKGHATKSARVKTDNANRLGYSIPEIARIIYGDYCPTIARNVKLISVKDGIFPDDKSFWEHVRDHGITLHEIEYHAETATTTYRAIGVESSLDSLLSFQRVLKVEFEVNARVPNIQKTDYPHGKLHESQKGSAFSRFLVAMQKNNRRKFADDEKSKAETKREKSAALHNWRTNPKRNEDNRLVSVALANGEITISDFWEIVIGAWTEDGKPMK